MQPESAVNEFETIKPTIVMNAGLIEEERTMAMLFPVALMARPSLVFKNQVINTTVKATRIISRIRRE